MKPILLTLFAFLTVMLLSFDSCAQLSTLAPNFKIDSLKHIIAADREDTNKVLHLFHLSRELGVQNIDTAIVVGQQALEHSEQLNWKKGKGISHVAMGWNYYIKGDYGKALEEEFIGLKISEELHEKTIELSALSFIGEIYQSTGELQRALHYNLRALHIAESLNDDWNIARNSGIIGEQLLELKENKKALDYFQRALNVTLKINNRNGTAVWLGNIGELYLESGSNDTAYAYLQQSADLFDSLGNKWGYAQELVVIGKVFLNKGNYIASRKYLNRALEIADSIGSLDCIKNVYFQLSRLYEISTIDLPDQSNTRLLNTGQMRLQALKYYQQYIQFKDSLVNIEVQKKTLNIEFQKRMELEKISQEQMKVSAKQQLQKQIIIRNTFIAGSILLLLLIVLLINRNQLKNKIAMERMRNRLSRDLHDDLGSTLSSINILSRTAFNNLENKEDVKARVSLEKINERSQRLLDSMKDIIWNINPQNDSLIELTSRMREYASTILEAKNIDFTFEFPKEQAVKLPMEVKTNMYLIFKEAVNNFSKYSKCTKADLSLFVDDNYICLEIKDNGTGFRTEELSHIGGLQNMKYRAAEINGELTVMSSPGTGTNIQLTIHR